MRTPEEIAARIKMLREDSKNLRARLCAANDDKRYAVASHCHTAMACAETMIGALEWAMEGPSPAPAAEDGCQILVRKNNGDVHVSWQPLPAPPQADEVCEYCGESESSHTRCEACGYTECDKELHGDHDLCTGKAVEVTE